MANQEQQLRLQTSTEKWNTWRKQHPEKSIDLRGVDFSRANLRGANLRKADLRRANLRGANLSRADLSGSEHSIATLSEADLSDADLCGADLRDADLSFTNFRDADLCEANLRDADLLGASLSRANLSRANLSKANLLGADLSSADLREANLSRADLTEVNLSKANLSGQDLSYKSLRGVDLRGANLTEANLKGQDLSHKDLSGVNLSRADLSKTLLIETNLTGSTLTDCNIYGTAAWNVQLENATQKNLIITQYPEATITIDNLKVAQFIYLMLNNKEIRDVINTLTAKSVLILGRFTPERKAVLDALRDALRENNYLPILFDFEKPSSLNLTETITTLAHLSRFIIVDLTDPSSSPHEAASIIPQCQVPIKPILEGTGKPYAMFSDFKLLPWVMDLYQYRDKDVLITSLKEHIIEPAEQKAEELEKLKNTK